MVKLLLERNEVEVNLKDIFGKTALSLAAEGGHTEVVKLLLEQNEIEVNLKDNYAQTALSLAAQRGHPEAVKLLLERNAIEVDDYARSALSRATEKARMRAVW